MLESSQTLWRQSHTLCEQAKRIGAAVVGSSSLWGVSWLWVLVVDGALLHTLLVGSTTLYHTLATLGCFCASNPSPLPPGLSSETWVSAPSHPPSRPPDPALCPHTLVDTCPRLSKAARWHGPSVLVSLYSACCSLATAFFFSLWSSLSVPELISQLLKGVPGSRMRTAPLSQPPRETSPVLILSLFFFFFGLPSYMVIFLVVLTAWDLLEFNKYSMRIVPHVDVFWCICRKCVHALLFSHLDL